MPQVRIQVELIPLLVMGGTSGFLADDRTIDLRREPSPTITAGGIGVVCRAQYWLEVARVETGEVQSEGTGQAVRNS